MTTLTWSWEQLTETDAPNQEYSVLVAARSLGIPPTVHVAIETDIIHMHPSASGKAIGQTTFTVSRIFAAVVSQLSGGVYRVCPRVATLFQRGPAAAMAYGHPVTGAKEGATLELVDDWENRALFEPGDNAAREARRSFLDWYAEVIEAWSSHGPRGGDDRS